MALVNPAIAQDPQPAPVRVGGDVKPPAITKNVNPRYPPEALKEKLQGTVTLEATIGPTGTVVNAVVRCSIPQFDNAALEAVRQWEFTPTLLQGKPVSAIVTVTTSFNARGGPPAVECTPVADPANRPVPLVLVTLSRLPDGTSYRWEIPRPTAVALAPWSPTASPVPLSIGDAAQKGEAWLRQRNQDIKAFEIANVNLSRMQPTLMPDRWYYRLGFDPIVEGRRLVGGGKYVAVVLLDGTVVEPRVEKP
jgi:TonB family protein